MATKWSDDILIAELADEPALSEELASVLQRIEGGGDAAMGDGEKKAGAATKASGKGAKAQSSKAQAGASPADVAPHVVLNFANVTYIGSSNIGQLLQIRKGLADRKKLMKICSVNEQVWSIFLVTGLDKVFRFAPDPMTALAGIQIEAERN